MTTKTNKIPACSICGGPLHEPGAQWKGGNNAAPVNDGRCCNDCNATVVVPRRLRDFARAKHGR